MREAQIEQLYAKPRPLYETHADRAAEEEVIFKVEALWDCYAIKLKLDYKLDYALGRGEKLMAFAEVKCRNYAMADLEKMGGYMLSLSKWAKARELCEMCAVPFMLIVKATDGLFAAKITDFKADPREGGRTDRGDWQDRELCVFIPVAQFKRLG